MKVPLYFSAKSIGMSRRNGRKPQTLLVAARHNLRELQADSGAHEGIASDRSHLNVVLHGPNKAADIVACAESIKTKCSVPKRKLRKDHVQALEFVVSVRAGSNINPMAYFKTSVDWFADVFGVEMLLSAVVHFDEAAPHLHVLILPIKDGEYQGGSAIKISGLCQLTLRFAKEVGQSFGLSFEPKPRMTSALRRAASELVLGHLAEKSDPLMLSSVLPLVVKQIKNEPSQFIEALGLQIPKMPRSKGKTLAQYMTGTGRKTSEDRDRRRTHHLSSVGFGKKDHQASSNLATTPPAEGLSIPLGDSQSRSE